MTWPPTELPEDWDVGNIRRFAEMKTGHTPSRSVQQYWENATIPWFTLADVWQLRDGRQVWVATTTSKISELGLSNSAAELLPKGTVLLSRTASVGFSGVTARPMATSQDYWNWVCGKALEPRFLNYQFKAMSSVFASLTMGSTHKTIYAKDAAGLTIVVPPIRDQVTIADYLDRETAKIDALLAKQERMIELLRYRRHAALDRLAITGVNRGVALHESGVAWLGPIPSHWEVRPLWTIFKRVKDTGHPDEEMLSVFREHGVVRKRSHQNLNQTAENRDIYQLVHPGWLLVNRMKAWQGSVGISPFRGITSGHYICFAPTTEADAGYLNLLLRSKTYTTGYRLMSRGVRPGQIEIDNDMLRTLPIVLPPPDEQLAILQEARQQTEKVDRLISHAERFIDLSRERRAALIAAAVAGQIDVRGAA